MKNKRPKFPFLLAYLFAAVLLACGRNGDPAGATGPFDLNSPRLDFKVGEKRVLLREFSHSGERYDYRAFTLGVFETTKDTVMEGNEGWIVESVAYELLLDSIMRFSSRQAIIREGNGIAVYEFRSDENSAMLFGLLKKAEPDTVVFSDRMTVLEYPLVPGRKWGVRPLDGTDPWNNLGLEKEYRGMDTLEFGGKRFECAKFTMHSFVAVDSWVSSIGLLKAEIDLGWIRITDSNDVVLDSTYSRERYDLLAIDPTDAYLDSLKAHYRGLYRNNLPVFEFPIASSRDRKPIEAMR